MALQSSGAISLANIQAEFGGSNPIGLNEYYGAASGIPTYGTISLANFYGASFVINTTEDITPNMTSNTSPSGTVFSNNANPSYPAWGAFNTNTTNDLANGLWQSTNRAYPIYIGYIFPAAKIVNRVFVMATGVPGRMMGTYTIQGSNDTTTGLNGTWTTVRTVTGSTGYSPYQVSNISFTNTTAYKAYRFNITNNGGDVNYVAVQDIKLVG